MNHCEEEGHPEEEGPSVGIRGATPTTMHEIEKELKELNIKRKAWENKNRQEQKRREKKKGIAKREIRRLVGG